MMLYNAKIASPPSRLFIEHMTYMYRYIEV